MNKWIDFFLCLFLGYLGVHKFYEGKNKIGLLYLFTCGLCGIGWIHDILKLFIKLISNNSVANSTTRIAQIVENETNIKATNIIENTNKNTKTNGTKNSFQRFNFIDNNMVLKYSYYDVDVHGLEYRNINISTLNTDDIIEFEPEPDNPYDKNAIKILCKSIFIGYIPRNSLQEMILTYLIRKNKEIKSYISMIDVEYNKIQIAIGFYQEIQDNNLENLAHIDAPLIKTSKKDFYDNSRQENLECVSEGEKVFLEYQFDTETFLVTSETGDELGEISKSVTNRIENCNNIHAFILKLDETEDLKIKCKIRIYI